ncbi:MAG: MBL fold metallo-hydrolase [Parvibaculum sp.]
MKKLVLGIFGIGLVLAVGAMVLIRIPAVQDALFDRAVEARVNAVWSGAVSEDALQLVFCGTGSPMPDKTRGQACVAVIAGDRMFLVDTGSGAAETLAGLQVPMDRLIGILYTHFHSDHISGLYDVVLQSWVAGRKEALPLYGPVGVNRLEAGFNEAFALDRGYRVAHHNHTEEVLVPANGLVEGRTVLVANDLTSSILYDEDGLKITAFRVDHAPIDPAYGYRVDYKGRSVVFSGDTVKHPNMVRIGKDADVMVHEALAPHMVSVLATHVSAQRPRIGQIIRDTLDYHASPVEAAVTANEAGAGLLVYSHIVPPLPNGVAEAMFLRGVSDVRPAGVELGFDGMQIVLPVGAETTIVNNLN